MNWEKLPAGTEFTYAQQFYTVKNVRGGFAWNPVTPQAPVSFLIPPTDFTNNPVESVATMEEMKKDQK